MRLARVEFEWEDGSIERLTGDAAEQWYKQQSGACSLAWTHGIQHAELPWEVVRAKTHDVPDGLDPIERRVMEDSKRFDAALPELRQRYAGRWIVYRDGAVISDHTTFEGAYKDSLDRYGFRGGCVVAQVTTQQACDVMGHVYASVLGTHSFRLEDALRKVVESRGWQYASFERMGRSGIKVIFGKGPNYYEVKATVDGKLYSGATALDEALYHEAARLVTERIDALEKKP